MIDLPEMPLPDYMEYRDRLLRDAERELRESIPETVRHTCPLDERLVVGRPYREILRLAQEQATDLIVMGVRGRGALNLALFGSTTQVVRGATCPVLTVRES